MDNANTPPIEFEPKPSKASGRVLGMLRSLNLGLIINDDGDVYASLHVRGHMVVYNIGSKDFTNFLSGIISEAGEDVPTPSTMTAVIATLQGRAFAKGLRGKVAVRLAGDPTKVFVDMCNAKWQAIVVLNEGWEIVYPTFPTFRRLGSMLELPAPDRAGANVSLLWDTLNIHGENERRMVEAWLITALIPSYHVPLLVLNGEHGSAKSTTTRYLRNLLDPNTAPLRSLPDNEKDLFVAARNSRILTYDNMSGISGEISDGLCKLVSGGAYSGRMLYTDKDEVIINAHCAVILNGITDFISRPDLIDRSLVINLPTITASQRKSDKLYDKLFTQNHPKVFAGLLDTLVEVLKLIPTLEEEDHDLPRMADFALVGVALERLHGYPVGSFLKAYKANMSEAVETSLEASPVAETIKKFMLLRQNWEGTTATLLSELTGKLENDFLRRSNIWPQTPNALSKALSRLKPAFRVMGVTINSQHTRNGTIVQIRKSVTLHGSENNL